MIFCVGRAVLQGGFRRLRAASDFLDGQKVTKEPLGGRLRMDTSCPYSPTLPPLSLRDISP